MPSRSLRAPLVQHGLDRFEENEEVQRQRQVLDVVQVVLQLLERAFYAVGVVVADLRPSCYSRFEDVTLTVERDLVRQTRYEFGALGPRADQTHLATEHVPQLRQFVEPRPAQESADRGDP